MPKKLETEEVETSDDDFVHPSMEKYFSEKEKKLKTKQSKKKNKLKEQEEEEEEEEEESDYDVENEFKIEKALNDENDNDEDEDDEEDEDEEDEEDDHKNQFNADNQIDLQEGENDTNEEDSNDKRKVLTLKLIDDWSNKLNQEKPIQTIFEVVKAFKSALLNVIPSNKSLKTSYKVEGTDLFNAMVRLCLRDLLPCLLKLLNLNPGKSSDQSSTHKLKLASSGSHWKKIKQAVKSYLGDMLLLASNIFETEILNAILRHLRLLVNFYMCFPKLLKSLMRLLITVWSQNDEKSRVLSFLCLHKIIYNTHEKNQDFLFKSLYLSFVRNAKFTSINTLPLINFMQRSLIELYATNTKLAYEHIFVYIRQLAIHLRNALNLKKKESYQAVYNWQYIHSLILWSKLLSELSNSNRDPNNYLQSLIYPLVQCIIGSIKLIPTPRYYPLRFHCVNALILISSSTNVFIPIIPFILEVFDITDFNKKHATISPKPISFSFLLKLNKQQLQDKSFKDVLIDIIYDNLVLLLQHQSYDIAFPELVLPLIIRRMRFYCFTLNSLSSIFANIIIQNELKLVECIQWNFCCFACNSIKLKDFIKKCKNPNYCKVIKGLLDKIQENSKFIEEKRNKVTFSIRDKKQVDLWVDKNKEAGTPLSQWYTRYKTMREREIMMELSNKQEISKNKVPKIERPVVSKEDKEKQKKEFEGLFVNMSEEESDNDELDFVPKKREMDVEDNFSDLDTNTNEKDDDDDDESD